MVQKFMKFVLSGRCHSEAQEENMVVFLIHQSWTEEKAGLDVVFQTEEQQHVGYESGMYGSFDRGLMGRNVIRSYWDMIME
ncbi:hypothetical protein Tco_0434985 [Tanacetum coccineum]